MNGGELFDAIVARGEKIGYTEQWAQKISAIFERYGISSRERRGSQRSETRESFVERERGISSSSLLILDLWVFWTRHIENFTIAWNSRRAAPEILLEKDYGTEVDMWSFACGALHFIMWIHTVR